MSRIAILTGGVSAERPVALKSAEGVRQALAGRYEIEVFDWPAAADIFLARRHDFAAVIPVLHGRGGEDGTIQGLLESLGRPYLFSGVAAQALGLDKTRTKALVAAAGVPILPGESVRPGESAVWRRPVVVKPNDGGSSVGTSLVRTAAELPAALAAAWREGGDALVEDLVEGDEYTVAIADLDRVATALPVIAIRPRGGWFDFAAKYEVAALAEEICPAPISTELSYRLQELALTAHRTLGCRHISRADFMVDRAGQPWFLEINTIPGMTETSLVPKAIRAAGRDVGETIDGWIADALAN
ncbi:hypothetical protein A3C96_00330 [Candidatus Uhrbacteria bacterium RIFCSPHIGHO2_02_FULL_60_10]|uniref:D-alanine--D-alanine ligase n=1 Tax=Candidatus Uhrbacteria bacterium RIFCSPHIGHO2_02_FULL_60_10 TaxID=1802392 RepID=A0A1F7U902_9BACT|nr:MAG: hypothetical protein A3C96_00330 [Candidatus Uhrbacteria bacterium RIFCSPHIGHO2_02_FULL_60_10]